MLKKKILMGWLMKVASIILCAGVGSRLKSSKSKILHDLCGRPMGYWTIKNTLAVTDLKPIVVVNPNMKEVEIELRKYFEDKIDFAYQNIPNGTGGAVIAAIDKLDKKAQSVLVINGDTPLIKIESLRKLITIQKNSHAPISLLSAIAPDPAGYGRIIRNKEQQIVNIVEDHEASMIELTLCEVNTGVYAFDSEFLRAQIKNLKSENLKSEFYLTDMVPIYAKSNLSLGPVGNVAVSFEEMHGVNDRLELSFAQKVLNRRLIDQWMLFGVTFIDPDNSYIEESVRLSKDVVIYPGVHLRGSTQVAEGAIIENGAVLINTVIEKNAHILPYSHCEEALIGENSHIGPFARLRPKTTIDKNCKVGNFTEINRSRLQAGVKAAHFSYIGDAEVGPGANIGAGTVTCNYDGKNKHKTLIGERAFVGSNSTLVAPLVIGQESYIAGGSTIVDDVPQKALAFGRAHQVNKVSRKEAKTSAVI
jgi:bifunctional UDP-N-acetylglucosamine pyrophosphorylase/glucosamine-1-phosphate N-acetyltransferase